MAIENINDYAGMWANGVNIGELWDKIKAKFVAGFPGETGGDPAIDQSSYSDAWKTRARANIGLTASATVSDYNDGAGFMWYASGVSAVSTVATSTFGRGLLNATSGQKVDNLWAEKATKDGLGNTISTSYGRDLAFNTSDGNTYLKLTYGPNSYLGNGVVVNGAAGGLAGLDGGGKLPLKLFPDAIAGQMLFAGTVDEFIDHSSASPATSVDLLKVTLTDNAANKLHEKISAITTSNKVVYLTTASSSGTYNSKPMVSYVDCEGMYFLWTSNAIASGQTSREWSGERFQVGDWLVSVGGITAQSGEDGWRKIDNTDAVTSVAGINDANVDTSIYGTPTITGAVVINAGRVRALDTGLPNNQQTVAGKVQFAKDIWSLGGMAAYGISDLSQGGGGGGGTIGTILRNWSSYTGGDTEVLGSNLGIRGFKMSGASFQYNKPAVSNNQVVDDWQTAFTLDETNIPNLPLTQITGTDDLRAIEALTATSGYLKKTEANIWALRSTSDVKSDLGITGDIITHNASEFVAASAVKSLTIKGGNDTAVTYSPTANANSTLTLKAGTNIGVAVNGSEITISNSYSLPAATSSALGGIKIADPFTINSGTLGIGSGKITNTMLANSKFTIGSTEISLGSTHTAANFRSYLGLGGAALRADDYYVNAIGVSGDNLTYTKGSTTTNVTVPYASATSRFKSDNSFTNQLFTYRQSPQTINADSFYINVIKGRTYRWNQLVSNGDFTSTTGWTSARGTISASNNKLTYTITQVGNSTFDNTISCNIGPIVSGHQYMFTFTINIPHNAKIGVLLNQSWQSYSYDVTAGEGRFLALISASSATNGGVYFGLQTSTGYSVGDTLVFSNVEAFDLTSMFGAGNEPSMRDFADLFTRVDYPYSTGELINNDADAIETIGFNKFDENSIKQGIWLKDNGDFTTEYSDRYASPIFYPCVHSKDYYLYSSITTSDYAISIAWYDSALNCISVVRNKTNKVVTAPARAAYFRIATLGGNICINISDTNKNGSYERYERTTLDVNLKNIQVKSHNIWDEEWEVGYVNPSTGADQIAADAIRSKNYIPILPSRQYYIKTPYTNYQNYPAISFYDKNKVYVGYNTSSGGSRTFTTPANAYYMRFGIGTITPTYNNDICINESSSFNGQYEPHGILTINGLKQAGSVYDEIVGNKLVKRVGVIDLATVTFVYDDLGNGQYRFTQRNVFQTSGRYNDCICSRYALPSTDTGALQEEKTAKIFWTDGIAIKDMSYANSDLFNAAMQSQHPLFHYPLATPIEYELASPIPTAMPAGTTERIISERLPVTPFACDMTYGANPKDILASGVAWERIWNRPILAKGLYSDATLTPAISTDDQNNTAWFKLPIGDTALYIKFAVGDKAFKLQVADDDVNPTVSKEFEFATLSTADINAICV